MNRSRLVSGLRQGVASRPGVLREIFARTAFALAFLAAISLGPIAFAQDQKPGYSGRPPGAPAFSHGKRPGADPAPTAPGLAPAAPTPAGAFRPTPVNTAAPGRKTPAGERFFIVASVDLQKSQLLLKYPTEVTVLMRVDDATKLADDSGRPLKLSDFRAGDTVWAASADTKDGIAALRVRKGQMNVADLHRYYLDFSAIK